MTTKKETIIGLRKSMFMEDGKTPRCMFCRKAMHNYTPTSGRFKGQLQKYEWVCDCPEFKKAGCVLSAS
jgi:hypothetical protein